VQGQKVFLSLALNELNPPVVYFLSAEPLMETDFQRLKAVCRFRRPGPFFNAS